MMKPTSRPAVLPAGERPMPRLSAVVPVLVLWLTGVSAAWGHHLSVKLEARAGGSAKSAGTETVALGSRPKPRGALELRAGEPIRIHWTLTSTDRRNTYKDVLVHGFVVKIDRSGQAEVPKLDRDVLLESALTMDFKPGDRAEGDFHLTIDRPGAYLLRLETIGAAVGLDGHEHFAAMDLVVR